MNLEDIKHTITHKILPPFFNRKINDDKDHRFNYVKNLYVHNCKDIDIEKLYDKLYVENAGNVSIKNESDIGCFPDIDIEKCNNTEIHRARDINIGETNNFLSGYAKNISIDKCYGDVFISRGDKTDIKEIYGNAEIKSSQDLNIDYIQKDLLLKPYNSFSDKYNIEKVKINKCDGMVDVSDAKINTIELGDIKKFYGNRNTKINELKINGKIDDYNNGFEVKNETYLFS